METGAITGYIDVAQLVLYGFWIFFAGLIIYLRREDKREGYPLDSERSENITVQGYPEVPKPKTFKLEDGRVVRAPAKDAPAVVENAEPTEPWPGAPLEPVGDPMLAGVGPGTAGVRSGHPDVAPDGGPKIQPLSVATEFSIESRDPNPVGMQVIGLDGESPGSISDVWIDREDPQIRYLEVELTGSADRVLVPMSLARVDKNRRNVHVNSLRAEHFVNIPRVAAQDRITLQEEELVVAYFGAGQLYATAERSEPFV